MVDVLKDTQGVESVVVVGAGPFIHLNTVLEHQKKYIGIDPCLYAPVINSNKILVFNSFFEDVKREQLSLSEDNFIFLFCFNVMFYLERPEEHIKRLLEKGDIVIISQWSCSDYAVSLMKKYFHYVYKNEKKESGKIIHSILNFKFPLSSLKLSRIEKAENEVNSITIGYFG